MPQSLDVHHISDGPGAATFPNGCHIAEVEVDPDTGVAELVKYTCVNDFGTVVNPLIVAGQLHGGVVQGIGQALMEMTVYDGDGQLLTGSFMDYAMPRAADMPVFDLAEHPGAGEDQSARRQGLRRSRLRRLADLGHECGARRAGRSRHPPSRHAADAVSHLAGSAASERQRRGTLGPMTQAISVPARRFGELRVVGPICAAHFVSHYYMIMLAPLFAFVRADYGVSYTDLALALTAFNVVSAVLQTPAGFLVDRIGARIVLIAGVALGAVAFAVVGIVNSFVVFIAMYAVAGLGNTAYHPADYSLLSHHSTPARIGQIFSFHTFSGILGAAVAPATLLAMQSRFGWRGAYVGAAMLGLAVLALLISQRPTPADRLAEKRRLTPAPEAPTPRQRCRLAASALAADHAQSLFLCSDLGHGRAQ